MFSEADWYIDFYSEYITSQILTIFIATEAYYINIYNLKDKASTYMHGW